MKPDRAALPYGQVLVTGGTGFVGRYLVPALRRALSPESRIVIAGRSLTDAGDVVGIDLKDPASIAQVVANVQPNLIVHLAAQASVGRSGHAAGETWKINLGGTLALAEAAARYAPNGTFFFASTVEVYGLSFNEGVVHEGACLQPQSSYARSKAAAEAMLQDVLPESIRLIVARASNHSGAGQSQAFVVPAFAAQVAAVEVGRQQSVKVGNLDAERDFLDVADVVDAYIRLLQTADTLPMRSTFNVSRGSSVRVREILDRLLAFSPHPIPVELDRQRLRPSEVPVARVDHGALADATSWRPEISLEQTLLSVLEHERTRQKEGRS